MFIADPGSGFFSIPDPGVKEAPDPGSGSATKNWVFLTQIIVILCAWNIFWDIPDPGVKEAGTESQIRIRSPIFLTCLHVL
jgi:hypothetical protein